MGPSPVRACGTSLVRWMALQCAKRTARRLALQCARRTEAPCAQASTAVREAHCAHATGIYIKICAFSDIWKFEVEIFFRDQQCIVYEIRIIAIRKLSPPFGEEHRGLEQDISFPANKHLHILRKCYAVHINASSL